MIRLALFLIGASILAMGAYVMHLLPVQPLTAAPDWTEKAGLITGVLGLLAVTLCLPLGVWRRLTDPDSLTDTLVMGIFLAAASFGAIWHFRELETLLLPDQLIPVADRRRDILAGLAALALLFSAIKGLRRASKRRAAEPAVDRRGSKVNTAPVRTVKQIEVPDSGFLMKTYIIADWLLLRVFGAMLLFMAYMIHSTEEWELYKVGGMLYGIAPTTVTYVYAAWGAMLLVPMILPRFISRPVTVLGGAGKSAVLVGLAIIILPGIDAAIDTYAGSEYRAAFRSSVPGLFKGVAGLAVFSAMAIALFRALSRTPPVVLDGMGKPAQRFSADDLRALRAARMEG